LDRLRLMPDRTDVFTPIRLRPAELAGKEPNPVYTAIARLKRATSIPQARSEIAGNMARLRLEHSDIVELHPIIESLETTLAGDTRKALLVMLGAVGLVLLIVCVNLANLMLVRGANRQRELAVRAVGTIPPRPSDQTGGRRSGPGKLIHRSQGGEKDPSEGRQHTAMR